MTGRPLVSVIVVNFRGADDTVECLRRTSTLAHRNLALELICVDNDPASGDAQRIAHAVPEAKIVQSESNRGFAGGCNLGAAHASGSYLAFINNDAVPESSWLDAAVAVFGTSPQVGCVASKVLDWTGESIDYVGSALSWFGFGWKPSVGQPLRQGLGDDAGDVLFATGAGMVVRSDVFRQLAGFDEHYFMFFEDVDLGWRLNLVGHTVRYVPQSVVRHRHHATAGRYGSVPETYLLERNALFTIYKNYDDDRLRQVLPAALGLSVSRGFAKSDVDSSQLDMQAVAAGVPTPDRVSLPANSMTGAFAVDQFVQALPWLEPARREVQSTRLRTDQEILPLFGDPLEPTDDTPRYVADHTAVVDAFAIGSVVASRRRILVITREPLGNQLAGLAIRAWEMARSLSREHEVILASTTGATRVDDRIRVVAADDRILRRLCASAHVIITQPWVLADHPWLADVDAAVVGDVYDPVHLEVLEQQRPAGGQRRMDASQASVAATNLQLARSDFLLCASERQRQFWLGQLAGLGRVNPLTYDNDQTLSSLLAIVPFGLPDEPPRATRTVMRGVVPGIEPDDRVLLWGGGIYDWLDPLTPIEAMSSLRERRDDVRLFFLGAGHPSRDVPEMAMAAKARQLAEDLGLLGRHVFFNDTWVDYEDRANYLLESDLGVSCHLGHVETTFAFRTRILDCFWAGLPVIATGGDALADVVSAERLGAVVPVADAAALADAIDTWLDDEMLLRTTSARAEEVAAAYTWPNVLQPLLQYCRQPRRAADLVRGGSDRLIPGVVPRLRPDAEPRGAVEILKAARRRFSDEGTAGVARAVRQRLGGR